MVGGNLWQRLLAAVIVATGVGIVWAMLLAWGGSLAEGLLFPRDQVYEMIAVTRDGTPVIQTNSYTNYDIVTYRSLDGEPLTIDRENWLSGASLVEPRRPPGLVNLPIAWQSRIIAVSDSLNPPNSWYLIRDDHPEGRAYVAGYDEIAKRPIGYMARQGFRTAMPERDQRFDVGLHQFGWGSGAACSTGYLNYGGRAYNQGISSDEQRIPEWILYVLDDDRVMEIDLRSRKVRPVFNASDLVAVAMLAEVQKEAPADDDSASRDKPRANVHFTAHTMQETFKVIVPSPTNSFLSFTANAPEKLKTEIRLAIRTLDRIVVFDPPTDTKREFLLPEPWRERYFDAYAPNDQELLLVHRDWSAGNLYNLLWLGKEGQIIKERSEALAGYRPHNERAAAMLGTIAAPVPAGWYLVTGSIAPLAMVQENEVPTYAAGLARMLDVAWPALILVTLIGLLLALVVWKWQRKYHRPGTAVWCGFVFLAGLPGLLAYWLEHRRAKLETCAQCGSTVPRDRDACAGCDSPFLAPQLLGTEIFS